MSHSPYHAALKDLPLAHIRYFASIGSTNDEALAWAAQGAPDFSIVIADEQTSGRGRLNRRWFTPANSALAFSLILRPQAHENTALGRFAGLGALALQETLGGGQAQIKWPNDVLLNGKKIAGILVEAVWMGDQPDSVILGMGVNVAPESVPPPAALQFPATCLATENPPAPPRDALLHNILHALLRWRTRPMPELINAWESALAFREQDVSIWQGERGETLEGRILGLTDEGHLRLGLHGGGEQIIHAGEVRLRPSQSLL
jgi:BirA family transcriptional regulator, biotin operon repressor / biotin---[acetyl-CoA-carboxylase] ligase